VPHFQTRFHHCQFGSSRRKYTLLVHNIPTLQALECHCDNSHSHEPWGPTPHGWATALETAYPGNCVGPFQLKWLCFCSSLGSNVPPHSSLFKLCSLSKFGMTL
jgi:hypothetical protein